MTITRCLQALLLVIFCVSANAQPVVPPAKCEFRDNEFLIDINKKTSNAQLEQFIIKYDLKELDLKNVLRTNNIDTLKMLGWEVNVNNRERLIIKRALSGSSNLGSLGQNIDFPNISADIAQRFPTSGNGILYGYNRFRNKYLFWVKDGATTFFLRNHLNASKVILAGSFNNFSPEALRMKRTDSGWVATVKLAPGKYWYKFITDGNWMVDDDNYARENDGQGNTNSVYFQPNHYFRINGFGTAKKVYVMGSFNTWRKQHMAMTKTNTGWELPVYLANGTHTYQFLVDNVVYLDANNPERLPDGNGGQNAVIRLGNSYTFLLNGYTNARQVYLAGSFNSWRERELLMHKTSTGWELPYNLGAGNYQYKFIVDGNWILDPGNPLTAATDGITNSYLIISANYTFRLKGMAGAKSVFLAGDFNNWAPNILAMKKDGQDWISSVYLAPGKHKYKFIVDGKWITDPNNKTWEQNEEGTGNSVIWIDK
ncbi:MAG: glycogen-binding domain-containing protein [Bacteroidota bacterium]